jgi:PHP family Zn ribbon phosphoesterase
MLKEFRADLHIHTCLSPCASLDLSPRKIVERAKAEHLDIIAVTDHNTAKNVRVVMIRGEKEGLKVIPGMEVQSREEIHILTLFPDWPSLSAWEAVVRQHLPETPNDPEFFGDQPVVDEDGNILEFEERLLINSLGLSLEEIRRQVLQRGGVFIPAHFDKESMSLISQLGFVPFDLDPDALEMGRKSQAAQPADPRDPSALIPRIVCSDAHRAEEIGRASTVFLLAEPSLEELRLAFRRKDGRKIVDRVFPGSSPGWDPG